MRKHILVVTALTSLASAALAILFLRVSFTPEAASAQAQEVDRLLAVLLSIGAIIFALCLIILIYNVVVFRHRPGDLEDGPPVHGHSALEMLWTVVPLAIVLFLGFQGALTLRNITQAPENELEVKVTAFQWAWRFEYPDYGITTAELRLPVDRPILFRLTSRDVIHSFWVTEWRVKQDAVPGMEKVLRVTPTKVGSYKAWCAELCGLGHSIMQAPVTVVEPGEFERWVKEQRR